MVRALVRAWDCHTSVVYIYWVDTRLYLLSLVNDLGVILTSASFSVRSPGLALLLTLALSCELFDWLGVEST